jgi:hypothetical protein
VEKQKNWWTKNVRKGRAKVRTHDDYRIRSRTILRPVEYALINAVQADLDETHLKIAIQTLEQLRRSPLWQSMSVLERQIPIDEVFKARARVDARNKQVEKEKQFENDSKFDVIEKVEEVDPRIYKIMKILGKDVITSKNEEGGKSNNIIKWNPIKKIGEYRRSVDPLRHLDIKSMSDFFATRVAVKYPSLIIEYQSPEKVSFMDEAFKMVNTYREQFSNKKWRYTWVEWFWIVAYTKSENIGKTRSMLRALDGKEGIMSYRHVRNMIERVIKFWEDYFEYVSYFFEFFQKVQTVIEGDQELNSEYKKMLLQDQIENEKYIMNMLNKHFKNRGLNPSSNGSGEDEEINKEQNLLNNGIDFKITRTRPDRIRIYHYNQNYTQEIDEYKKGLRKERPKIRKRCGPFSLSKLPSHAVMELYKQGKLKI